MQMRFALPCLAGLMGAAGVALAARAAHAGNDASLMTAALFLLIHAAAVTGIAGLAPAGRAGRWILAAALVLALGTVLFSADLAIRHFGGSRLFVMAAPAGGTLMILGWIAICLASVPQLPGKQD